MTSAGCLAGVPRVAPRARAGAALGRRRRPRVASPALASANDRDPWRTEPDLPPPREIPHHRDGLGEKLSGVLTEFLVRAPAQFLVENVLAPLYARGEGDRAGARRRHRLPPGASTTPNGDPSSSDCDGRGMYLDVETDSCVYICREGYVWDAATRSCKLIVTNPESRAATVDAHVPAVGRKPGSGQGVRKAEAPGALPDALEARFYGGGDESPLDGIVRWLVNRAVGGGRDEERCAVGFFYDAKAKKCTPICRPGYVYDPVTKKCVSADVTDRLPL